MHVRQLRLNDFDHSPDGPHARVAGHRRSAQLQTTFCCVSSLKIDVLTEQPFLTGWQPKRSQATCGAVPAVEVAGVVDARPGA